MQSTGQAAQMAPVPAEEQPQIETEAIGTASEPKKRSYVVACLAGAAVLLLIIGVAVLVNLNTGHPTTSDANSSPLRQMVTQPTIRSYTSALPRPNFAVPAGRFYFFRFNVPQGSTNVRLDGSFEAAGGRGNDIEVFVVNNDGYSMWMNHQQASAYYNSGRVTTDTLNVQLPATTDAPATYYLVFNNRFSVVSNKAITSDIKLHYNHAY